MLAKFANPPRQNWTPTNGFEPQKSTLRGESISFRCFLETSSTRHGSAANSHELPTT
jgi:hypothetical protein